jgi:hypothetical protein
MPYDSEVNRESQLRRRLAKAGYRLLKTPARSALRRYRPPGFAVLHAAKNIHILGDQYSATLKDVELFANRLER